jgi:hypothetical protein
MFTNNEQVRKYSEAGSHGLFEGIQLEGLSKIKITSARTENFPACVRTGSFPNTKTTRHRCYNHLINLHWRHDIVVSIATPLGDTELLQ